MNGIARALTAGLLALAVLTSLPARADSLPEPTFPAEEWPTAAPEQFGFSNDKLKEVRRAFEKMGGDAFVVIQSGYLIAAWGDTSKPIANRSIRKSFLNSLLGIEYGEGNLPLDATLAELKIDDTDGLTASEKEATLRHLLTCSSGVFHPAAYESKQQKGARPPRGSFEPGAFFYYNNWDFNALGHIYAKLAQQDLFEAFEQKIANPIGMQDFDLGHTAYVHEDASQYPAYNFKSSARDDARFGHLFLRDGKWNDRQIVPAEWVRMSFVPQVKTSEHYYYDYGFLWWVDANNEQYFARGNSGQYIAVLPREDMVIVFRADPGSIVGKWLGTRVKPQESFPLIRRVLEARD